MFKPDRRTLMVGAASLFGAALAPKVARAEEVDPQDIYGAVQGEPFPVPAIDLRRIRYKFLRTLVNYSTSEPAGTIVIDPEQHYLYLVNGDGTAIRYGVGVGRQGFSWAGTAQIGFKREWPDWYPPKEMFARQPDIMSSMSKLQSGLGMHGGPGNPLGARAMYLYQNGKDTLYRIHGTIEPWTIGSSVSSGCIRMINQDVIDLYGRVDVGTTVQVLGPGGRNNAIAQSDQDLDGFAEDTGAPRHGRRGARAQDYYYDESGNAAYAPADGDAQ